MYFYLDGYNLLFNLMGEEKSLSSQRQTLIRFLQKQFVVRQIKGTLVFDGARKREEESGLSYRSPLEIVYAPKGQSADAYIIEQIAIDMAPKQIVVVTNDRELYRQVRALGAQGQGIRTFIQWLKKKGAKKKTRRVQDSPQNIDRLLKIFEERLKQGPSEEDPSF